jgi:1-phosphofructokinase family hexose kinase
MILVAGLSPAWQQIMRFDALCLGEVNRAAEVTWCASGKAINVAWALSTLGASVELISTAGGLTGEALRRDVEGQRIPTEWIETASPTRVCTTILDSADGAITELVENAPAIAAAELDAFRQAYRARVPKAQLVVLTGSLPVGTPANFYGELLSRTKCPAILDFRGRELWDALPLKPLLVKPNREELGHTVGRKLNDEADVIVAVKELHQRGARWVAITDGARPVLVSGPGTLLRVMPPRVSVVNAIAAGDCLTAGIAWATVAENPIEMAVRFGVAAAAQNVSQLLPARLNGAKVAQMAAEMKVEQL